MSIAEKTLDLDQPVDNTPAVQRIQDAAAYDPEFGDQLAKLALRFIHFKGLSDEFADIVDEANLRDFDSEGASPGP